jgi:hypothetical protein
MKNLKKRLICHRANLRGPDPERENSMSAIQECISLGYDVEIDVFRYKNKLYLGHDKGQEPLDLSFIKNNQEKLWIHCKDLDSLAFFVGTDTNFFWHQNDDYTLTSKKFIWTYPKKKVDKPCVIVCKTLLQTRKYLQSNAYKICTDYAIKF